MSRRTVTVLAVALSVAAALSGCGSSTSASDSPHVTLRLGYLTRITHASALVGLDRGLFTKNLGAGVDLSVKPFGRGTDETTALLAGQIDAAYVGPNPAFNAWQKSGGKAIKIISGAATGGTSMVVKPEIKTANDLRGKIVADPALGGTQDVSLRSWLRDNGLKTDPQGGGDVFVKPTNPESAIVPEFATGQIAGAVESAPYDVQMVAAGGTRLWSDPNTVTVLVVRQEFLRDHPDAVAGLLRGQVEADDLIHADPAAAARAANATLTGALGKGLEPNILAESFRETVFTDDPKAASLKDQVQKAMSVGLLEPMSLDGIFELRPLDDILATAGRPQVGA